MLVAQLNQYGVKGNPASVCSVCQRQIRERRRFPVFLSGNYEGGELRELVPGCSANVYLEYQRGCSMRKGFSMRGRLSADPPVHVHFKGFRFYGMPLTLLWGQLLIFH